MLFRSDKSIQSKQIAFTEDIVQAPGTIPLIQNFNATLLNHPDQRNLAFALAEKVFLRLAP